MRDQLLLTLKDVTLRWGNRAAKVDLSNVGRHTAMLLDDYLNEMLAYVRQLQAISVKGTPHGEVKIEPCRTKMFHVPALACAVLAYYGGERGTGPFTFTKQLIFE